MDLFVRDYSLGIIPNDYYEKSIRVPEKISNRLSEITQTSEGIFYNVFIQSDEQLFNSFISIIKEYSGRYEDEIEEMKESEEGKESFAWLLSNFKEYYFCEEGISVGVEDSFPRIKYSYIVGESVLHIYESNGLLEPKDLGVILLSDSTVKKLTSLVQETMKWTGRKPIYTFYDSSRRKRIYKVN